MPVIPVVTRVERISEKISCKTYSLLLRYAGFSEDNWKTYS